MSGKKDLIVGVMQSLIGKVDTKDLKSVNHIKSSSALA